MNQSFHNLLFVSQSLFSKRLYAALQGTGLTSGQPKVLEYLSKNDGSVQKDIAAGCQIEPATVTSLLPRMEAAGLIERRSENGNRRSLYVYLTDKGRADANRIGQAFADLERQAFEDIEDTEREAFMSVLGKICENLNGK
ncbi:MarR family transcriptional regulator [Eubacterium sp. 1001713B170207_170306_E7]|uniref:MarR family winged helix-turn-helix transcriptional regulator n=1 Tax=Eubacterium sp. 1001713B170207_170306_E7 TaxID=2787097 RepID=UPI00189A3324|nr:MarR family transcriptional regulator [Eubacterium sp. 1001713B170207_170306_E7]